MLPFDAAAAAADTIRALSLMKPQRMTAAMMLVHVVRGHFVTQ